MVVLTGKELVRYYTNINQLNPKGKIMKNMINNQRGVTFIGWLIILALIGFFVLLTMRLIPLYNEKMGVITAMNTVANRTDAGKLSAFEVRKYFLRNADINGIRRFMDRNVREHVTIEPGPKRGDPKRMRVQYESRNKFLYDLEFVLVFDRSVPLTGEGTGEN
jgi:hypothetical protein